jgi:hypothetical protein
MAKTLVDQLGPDTIVRFERSAPLRIEEGDKLAEKHPLTAIYLYGYAAEMIIKSAHFKALRFGATDEIDRDSRNRAMALARVNNLMGHDPHDIPGWARLLVCNKQTLHTPAYPSGLARQIVDNGIVIYENWRPQMRYRNTVPPPATATIVRTSAKWFVDNYARI